MHRGQVSVKNTATAAADCGYERTHAIAARVANFTDPGATPQSRIDERGETLFPHEILYVCVCERVCALLGVSELWGWGCACVVCTVRNLVT